MNTSRGSLVDTDTLHASAGSTARASKYFAWSEILPYVDQERGVVPGRYEFLQYVHRDAVAAFANNYPLSVSLPLPLAVLAGHLTVCELKSLARLHSISIEKGEGKNSILDKFLAHSCPDCGAYVSLFKSCSVSKEVLKQTFKKDHVDKVTSGVKTTSLHLLGQLIDLEERQVVNFKDGARLVSLERVDDVTAVPLSTDVRVVCHPVPWLHLVRHSNKPFQVYVAKLHGLPVSSRPGKNEIVEQLEGHVCNDCKLFYAVFEPVSRAKNDPAPCAKPYVAVPVYDYPPAPFNDLDLVDIVQDFCSDMKPSCFEEGGCAVCGQLTLMTNLTLLESINCLLDPLKELGAARLERKSADDPVSFVEGPILDPLCSGVCDDCLKPLRKGHRPTNALANGTWVGRVPAVLAELTYAEQCLISRVRCNR
jgi:hypothetical protein